MRSVVPLRFSLRQLCVALLRMCACGFMVGVSFGTIGSILAAESPSSKILFSNRVYQRLGHSYAQVWEIDPRDQRKVQLTSKPREHKQPLCSPNDQNIVFLSSAPGSSDDEIW